MPAWHYTVRCTASTSTWNKACLITYPFAFCCCFHVIVTNKLIIIIIITTTIISDGMTSLTGHHHHHYHHQFLHREGRWGTTDDFATSFLHFSLFSTALWDLLNSRPVHFLILSSHLFLVRLVFFPLSMCLARWFWPDLMNGKHDYTTAVCVSLRSSGDLHVVQLPAGSWHRLPRW